MTFSDLRAHPAFSREFGSPEPPPNMGEPGGEEVAGKGVRVSRELETEERL